METQPQNAINPNTSQEYQIEFPARELVRQAILELDYPDEGLRVRDAVNTLAEKFELSNEQEIAVNNSNLNVFRYNVVAPQFRQLLQKGELVQPSGPYTPYFLPGSVNIPPETESDDNSTESRDVTSLETTRRIAVDDTGKEYEIEIPAASVVKESLLSFEYPAAGIRIKDVAEILADEFTLTDEQRNAKYKYGLVWRFHVNVVANDLVNSGQLMRIKQGWIINPNQPEAITPDDTSSSGEDTPSPEVVMERKYQEMQNNLEVELLQKIKDNPPDFFEQLVLDLLVEMGYGGSRADAEAVGRSGDGGIDGIIKADPLGLNLIYVQAKRWEENVGEPPVRDFVGALDLKGATGGFFITTSDFNQFAKNVANNSSKQVILINGNQFAQLMIHHNVGVSTERTYKIKQIDTEYFGEVEE